MDIKLDTILKKLQHALDNEDKNAAIRLSGELLFFSTYASYSYVSSWKTDRVERAKELLLRAQLLLAGTPYEKKIQSEISQLPNAAA